MGLYAEERKRGTGAISHVASNQLGGGSGQIVGVLTFLLRWCCRYWL